MFARQPSSSVAIRDSKAQQRAPDSNGIVALLFHSQAVHVGLEFLFTHTHILQHPTVDHSGGD